MPAVVADALALSLAAVASVIAAVGVASLRHYFYAAHPYAWALLLWLLPALAVAVIPWNRPALGAAILIVGGAILGYAGFREFRRAKSREWAPTMNYRGEVGLLALVGTLGVTSAVGKAVGGDVASAIAFVAVLICCLGAIGTEERATRREFERLTRRVEDATVVDRTSDPEVQQLVLGRSEGQELSIALLDEAIRISVHLPWWPRELHLMAIAQLSAAERDRQRSWPTTGDAIFDSLVAVKGPDDVWRAVLTATARASAVTLIGELGAIIDPSARRLTVIVRSVAFGRTEQGFDTAVQLAGLFASPPTDAKQQVFESTREEPERAVRWNNYRWLAESSWNAPLVFRTAASDADREIAEWARAQLPPTDGAFR